MAVPTAVVLSYRLGGADGVAVEAAKWERALQSLGFATRRVAGGFEDGVRCDDRLLPFLGMDASGLPVDRDGLGQALVDADLVVVENICSLPVNERASRAAAQVLATIPGRVLFHHHDLPWERPEFAGYSDLPPNLPGSVHVTISDHARLELARRGIAAHTVRNAFDPGLPPGDRIGTRRRFGIPADDVVVLQPTRAIPRKEVGAGLQLGERLAAALPDRTVRYWLTGPAEDGFGSAVERILGAAEIPVVTGRAEHANDAYAAADVVVMPSSWEGFGNPVAEAILARRPVACAGYPVLTELLALGLEVLPLSDVDRVARFIHDPDVRLLERNREIVARELSVQDLPGRLAAVFAQVGWERW